MTPSSALEVRDAVQRGELTAEMAVRSALGRIDATTTLNAYITVARETAIARAAAIDRERRPLPPEGGSHTVGVDRPLLGVPVAVKDNICTRGIRTTAGSRTLQDYVPPYDATVISRLEAAGAVVVAKTNCDEFAMGSSTEHSAFGPARNPWDLERIAGGSSGGSAIAVATRAVPIALGSETGGSVRQPGALCGVLGLKPTYGRISRSGLLAFTSSVDQVGIFGHRIEDVALAFEVLAGPDPADATTEPRPVPDCRSATRFDVKGLRIGVPRHLLEKGVEPGVRAAFDTAIDTLRGGGASVTEVNLPHASHAIPAYAIVVMAEASSNLSRYDGVRYGTRAADAASVDELYERSRALFGREVKRRIMLGTYVLSAGYYDAYYLKAQRVCALIREDYERAFGTVDLVATPTSPTTAFRIGERVDDPVSMYLADVFTAAANLSRLPAISVPCGFSEGLPVGLHLTARAFDEPALFRAAGACERLTPWSAMAPPG